MRRFDATPRRATPKGHQSFISHTAAQSVKGLLPTSQPLPLARVAHDEPCLGGSGLVAGEIGFGGRRELAAFCRFAGFDEELFGSAWSEDHEQPRLGGSDGERVRCSPDDGRYRAGPEMMIRPVDVELGVAFDFGTRTSTTEMLPPVWLGRAFIVIRPPSYQNGSPSSARAITALPSHALHMGFLLQRT